MKKKARRSAKRAAKKRSPRKSARLSEQRHVPTKGLYGWITHTDLASTNPTATKAWCIEVLGWTFRQAMYLPNGGEVHLFAYSDKRGGPIRPNNPPELPGSVPYVHLPDAGAAFEEAQR